MKKSTLLSVDRVAHAIVVFRGQRVLLDSELADLYGVATKALNQAVKRNAARFPDDFVFRLSSDESNRLNRSQIVTGSQKHRDPRYLPYVFTEHGAIMAATVVKSSHAIKMSIYVVRAFVQLRSLLASNKVIAQKLEKLERRVSNHDEALTDIIKTIRQLMNPPLTKSRPIGFTANLDEE